MSIKINQYNEIPCPFCNGILIPGRFKEMASFSCSKCSVIISFRESLEEILAKLDSLSG